MDLDAAFAQQIETNVTLSTYPAVSTVMGVASLVLASASVPVFTRLGYSQMIVWIAGLLRSTVRQM